MYKIFEQVLRYIPAYLEDLFTLLRAPKTFIASKNQDDLQNNFIKVLIFLGITLTLILFLKASTIESGNFISLYVSLLIKMLLIVVLFSMAIKLAWYLVGGRAKLKPFIITYGYITGVWLVFYITFNMIGDGVVEVFSDDKLSRSDIYKGIIKKSHFEKWYIFLISIEVIGSFISLVWYLLCWGAYRQLNNLSKLKSFIAYILSVLFLFPLQFVLYFIGEATVTLNDNSWVKSLLIGELS